MAVTIFSKKLFDRVKDAQNSPFSWLGVVPSLTKLCQEVTKMNKQSNLQPALNKWGGEASIAIFVTDCRYLPVYQSTIT